MTACALDAARPRVCNEGRKRRVVRTVGLEIFDGHKLGCTGGVLGKWVLLGREVV